MVSLSLASFFYRLSLWVSLTLIRSLSCAGNQRGDQELEGRELGYGARPARDTKLAALAEWVLNFLLMRRLTLTLTHPIRAHCFLQECARCPKESSSSPPLARQTMAPMSNAFHLTDH